MQSIRQSRAKRTMKDSAADKLVIKNASFRRIYNKRKSRKKTHRKKVELKSNECNDVKVKY